jgi:hypothetical protein
VDSFRPFSRLGCPVGEGLVNTGQAGPSTSSLTGLVVQRVEEGRIAETWVGWDNMAFLSQPGLLPNPESTSE